MTPDRMPVRLTLHLLNAPANGTMQCRTLMLSVGCGVITALLFDGHFKQLTMLARRVVGHAEGGRPFRTKFGQPERGLANWNALADDRLVPFTQHGRWNLNAKRPGDVMAG